MLSRVRSFFVIARQSAFAYKGRPVDVREIGSALGVNYAVMGTVRRSADRVRIFVQLVDTNTRTQLWSERFDRAASDIFQLEDEIAEGAWWVVPGSIEDVFSDDPRPLWQRVLRRQPAPLSLLSTYPEDATLN